MIGKSCKLAVYFNGRYWESVKDLCESTGHSQYAFAKYLKLGAKCDGDLREMILENRKKGTGVKKVRNPIILNFDNKQFLFPNYNTAAKAFGIEGGSFTKDEIQKRLQFAGIDIKPITKEEYYERQAKRAV